MSIDRMIAQNVTECKSGSLEWTSISLESDWFSTGDDYQRAYDNLLGRKRSGKILVVGCFGPSWNTEIPLVPAERLVRGLLEEKIFVMLSPGCIYYESKEYQQLYRKLSNMMDNPPPGEDFEDIDELYERNPGTELTPYRQQMEDLREQLSKQRNPYLNFGILSEKELKALA